MLSNGDTNWRSVPSHHHLAIRRPLVCLGRVIRPVPTRSGVWEGAHLSLCVRTTKCFSKLRIQIFFNNHTAKGTQEARLATSLGRPASCTFGNSRQTCLSRRPRLSASRRRRRKREQVLLPRIVAPGGAAESRSGTPPQQAATPRAPARSGQPPGTVAANNFMALHRHTSRGLGRLAAPRGARGLGLGLWGQFSSSLCVHLARATAQASERTSCALSYLSGAAADSRPSPAAAPQALRRRWRLDVCLLAPLAIFIAAARTSGTLCSVFYL